MKWFFAVNEAALDLQRSMWEPMIRVAVESAKARTSLKPHMIVYGPGEDTFLSELRDRGVRIVQHQLTYLDSLDQFYGHGTHTASIASGAFLRTEIPLIEHEDDLVLYTDCDVMFERDPSFQLRPDSPFACAPEGDRNDYAAINTGVMLMNLPLMRKSLPAFTSWIRENVAQCVAFDQGAYKHFYEGQWDRLPLELNWKPYWGASDQASIVHFHGPKPIWAEKLLDDPTNMEVPIYNALVSSNPEGYRFFMKKWMSWEERCAPEMD